MTATGRRQNRLLFFVCAVLVVGTAALYYPVATYPFIDLDDLMYVADNPHVRVGITKTGLDWAFTQSYSANWHPLTWLSLMLDCEIFGVNAGSKHLVNVGFHIVNTVLLFLLLLELTQALWKSAFVAALFSWHPLHVESVAWITERKDVLSAFFFMLTLLAYVRYARHLETAHAKSRKWFWAAIVLFACGLMSKSMLVTLPFILLLLDYWPLQRLSPVLPLKTQLPALRALVFEKIPFFILSFASCALTVWAQGKGHAIVSIQKISIFFRVTNSLAAYLQYIEKMVWPSKLSFFYPFPLQPPIAEAAVATLFLIAITVLAVMVARRRAYFPVGWFWYLGMLVPVIGLVQVGKQSMADRYTYLPSIGLFILLAWIADDVLRRWKYKSIFLIVTAVTLLAACVGLTARQITFWQNDRTLFSHGIAVNHLDYRSWNLLGEVFAREGKYRDATNFSAQALQISPKDSNARICLAIALDALGRHEEALTNFQIALDTEPEYMPVHEAYAVALILRGRFDEAEYELKKAAQLAPDSILPPLDEALILRKKGRLTEAEAAYQSILKLDPTSDKAYAGLGAVFYTGGKTDDAISCYQNALRWNPNSRDARVGLGESLLDEKKFADAAREFSTVLDAMPENAFALDGLGYALAGQGQFEKAKVEFSKSISVNPSNADAHLHYAMCLAALQQTPEAVSEYRAALKLNDQLLTALNNLAWTLATSPDSHLRNGNEAVDLAEKACRLTNHQHPAYLNTLAAAYAEAGRFSDAVSTAEKARDIAANAGQNDFTNEIEQFLKLYRTNQPYREIK